MTPLGVRGVIDRAWRVAVITAVAASTVLLTIHLIGTRNGFLYDFRGDIYTGLVAILHGRDPYQSGYVAHLAALKRSFPGLNAGFAVPTKPAPILLLLLPFGLLPWQLSGVLFVIVSIAAVILGLRLLGVRDRRCYALALVSWPALFGFYLGNASPLLFFGLAVAWRWRDRVLIPALAITAVVVMKIFPWPVAVWLLITRRWRAFALSVAIGFAAVVLGWAAIGFAGMTEYPRMLSNLDFVIQGNGPSFVSFLMAIGVGGTAAKALALAGGASLLALAWRFARRPDGDRQAFGLAVMAALIAAPNIWGHYLVLMFVPIALMSPSLSALWFVPVLSGEIPTTSPGNSGQILFWVVLQLAIIARLCSTRGPGIAAAAADRPASTPRAVRAHPSVA